MLLPSMRWGSMVLRMEMMLTILMVCDKMSPIYFGVFYYFMVCGIFNYCIYCCVCMRMPGNTLFPLVDIFLVPMQLP